MKKFVLSALLALFVAPAFSADYSDLLNQGEGSFNQSVQENEQWLQQEKARDAQRAAEQKRHSREAWKNRDRSKDVCFQLDSGSDAQTACLGKHPHAVKNDRARNILLGYCSSMGGSSRFADNLSYVCYEGKKGCSILDGAASYWCDICGGTRRWLAVYSLGHTIQCFN